MFFGHAIWHLGVDAPTIFTHVLKYFQGVPVFFMLSGFLIWNSLERSSDIKVFFKKRVYRLYPELWGAVLLNAIVMIVLYGSQIQLIPFIAFNFTQATIFQFWTPDGLRGYGCGTPNGALWTIGVMAQCYMVIWALYRKLHKSSLRRWIVVLLVGILCNVAVPALHGAIPELGYKLIKQTFIPYIWQFVFGAFLCEYFSKAKQYLVRFWLPAFLISALFVESGLDIGVYGTGKCIFLGMAIIGFGYRFSKLKIQYDISYSLYLVHMIVVNIFVEIGLTHEWNKLFIILTLSIVLAGTLYASIGAVSRYKRKKLVETN